MEMARDLMQDVSYFGTMMVFKGEADGMVSGAAHTTQHTIRPALQFVKTKPGVKTVSSVFFMCLPNRVSVFRIARSIQIQRRNSWRILQSHQRKRAKCLALSRK